MKYIFLIIDGLGDRPIDQLGQKTPLEAAYTPNLDKMAEKGSCGLVEPFLFPWQEYPASDTSHLALFGYDPEVYYLGRGPYEAAGVGMELKRGDVALRANFATLEEGKIKDRRAARIKDTASLVQSLDGTEIDNVKFFFQKSGGHRAVLVLRGQGLSSRISGNDPKKEGKAPLEIEPLDGSKEDLFTAKVLNLFLEKAAEVLKDHPLNLEREKQGLLPGNFLLVRGAGQLKKTPSFEERYGLKACCLTAGGLYRGVGVILGMEPFEIEDLGEKIKKACELSAEFDFVFCHVKETDEFSHDGDYEGKKNFIENIDKEAKALLGLKDTAVLVTGDHSTCCALKQHCAEPIPCLIYGKKADKVDVFGEKACLEGGLGRIKQVNLFNKAKNL